MTRRPRTRVAWVAMMLCATLVSAACTGEDEPASAPSGSPAPTPEATAGGQVATKAKLGVVAGDLPRPARKRVRNGVSRTVDRWIDAAYVAGDYPRSDFTKAFPRFTQGAARQARRQRDLMSNADIGGRIDGLDVVQRTVVVDAVADRRRAAGATARVRLRFRTSGELEQVVTVKGRLFLTPGKKGWRVFGFDMTKGVR